jgi:hypothetical protein
MNNHSEDMYNAGYQAGYDGEFAGHPEDPNYMRGMDDGRNDHVVDFGDY